MISHQPPNQTPLQQTMHPASPVAVIHGSVNTDGTFFFWGEKAILQTGKKRGRKPSVKPLSPHPFALSTAMLKTLVGQVLPPSAALSAGEHILYLPTSGGSPHPSPEHTHIRTTTGNEETTLKPWTVPVAKITFPEVLPFLLSPDLNGEGFRSGRSLAAWSVVALFACEIVARGLYAPALRTSKQNSLTGIWYPQLPDEEKQREKDLTLAMPPLIWAHLEDETRGTIGGEPVRIFLENAVNSLVTDGIRNISGKRNGDRGGNLSVEECFYHSLFGTVHSLPMGSPTVKELLTWLSGPPLAKTQDRCITCFTVQEPEDEESAWKIGFFLQGKEDPTLLVPAGEVWSGRSDVVARLSGKGGSHPQERMLYDLGTAAKVYPPIREALKKARPDGITLPPEQVYGFLSDTAPLLRELGCSVLLPSWWQHGCQRPSIRMKLKGKSGKGSGRGVFSLKSIVSFDWKIAIGDEELSPEEFQELAERKLPLMKVRGRWVVFDPDEVRRVIAAFKKEYPGEEMSLADALALNLGGPADEELPLTTTIGDTKLLEFFDGLVSGQFQGPVALPALFCGTLRQYQETGIAWLSMLGRFGMGACLADDMGLGKTVQVIAYLALRKSEGVNEKKTLLVCPMSIIGNWMRELHRFAPSIRVYIHQGGDRCPSEEFGRVLDENDMVITSYQTVLRDEDLLASHSWDCLVLDEAQNIKNHTTRQSRAVRKLPASARIALTGTPVENRLAELWSIMDFLNPGYLGTATAFQKTFASPIERQHDITRALALKKIISPFLLRRVKTDRLIISDLPEKMIIKEFCLLTKEQVSLYEAAVQDMLDKIDSLTGVARRGLVLVTLMRLKQICNHPSQFLNDKSTLAARSGKLDRLCEILEEVLANGDRAVIFTQFASFGGILKPYLESVFSTEVLFLHGKTKREDRDRMVAQFTEKKGPKLFILSLKAGGTGLNLISANHVFHFDRWWNPAVEDQATDRAFRIGQSKNVEVHLMITGGTLEEKIDAVLDEKRALAGSIIGAGEDWITGLPTTELRKLLLLRKDPSRGPAL